MQRAERWFLEAENTVSRTGWRTVDLGLLEQRLWCLIVVLAGRQKPRAQTRTAGPVYVFRYLGLT